MAAMSKSNIKVLSRSLCAVFGCVLLALSACAPKGVESKRFFWPPGLAEPKIEYINFYQVDQDVRRGEERWLEAQILGREKPKLVFVRPHAIASDGRGRILVSDIGLHVVFIYDLKQRQVRKLLQRHKGELSEFPRDVWGLEVSAAGEIYATLPDAAEIAVFGQDEVFLRTFGKGHVTRPLSMALDEARGKIYVVDSAKHAVVVFTANGDFLESWGQRGSAAGEFNYPVDVDVDADGNVYVLDSMNARVQVFDAAGRFLRTFGERGTAAGSFMVAKSLSVSPQGDVYVTDSLGNKVVVFSRSGDFLLNFGGRAFVVDKVTPGGFYLPEGIDVDANSTIWVVDSLNRMFHQFQYLDGDYLEKHPILPGQAYILPSRKSSLDGASK